MTATYETFQARPDSEKVGLAILQGARRVSVWTLYSGSIYSAAIDEQVLSSVSDDGVALTEAASRDSVTAGKFYHDREGGILYVRTSDSVDPDTTFLAITFKLFFATRPVKLAHDLSTGFPVLWDPLLLPDSDFIVEVENTKNLLGVALASASQLKFVNDREYWSPLFDNVVFDSHRVDVYSWNPQLPADEAKRLFRGVISRRTYGEKNVTFEIRDLLDELRAPVDVGYLQDVVGASLTESLKTARQRRVYGYVNGHVPSPLDQELTNGYPLTGTMSATLNSTSVTGVGTQFLKELSPGDDISIDEDVRARVESVTSDTALVLSEAYAGDTVVNGDGRIFSSHPKRYMNREFLVAGHALARPALTVTASIDSSQFSVDSTEDLREGDILEFAGSQGEIRVLGEGFVKLVEGFESTPAAGDTIYRSTVSNVYLDNELLELTDDYTYDETDGTLTLTETAEFNAARQRDLSGTITLSNGSRNVSGSSTQFRTELKPGDWIKRSTTWYEVLDVTDDTNLILRTACDASNAGTSAGYRKNPSVFRQGDTVLSCDVIGKADANGNLIKTAADISKDLLTDAGLSSELDEDSFTEGAELAPYRMGIAIPAKVSDKNVPSVREIISKVCRSAFASVVQTKDFALRFSVIEPAFEDEPPELNEHDMVDWKIKSDSSQAVHKTNVNYDRREWDTVGKSSSNKVSTYENEQYLSSTLKELVVDTNLVDEEEADIMASRWAFLLQFANSDVEVETKMIASRYQVGDILKLTHSKFYVRFGSSDKARIGAVVSVRKGFGKTTLLVTDLGNAFTRVARIAPDDQPDFDEASAEEKLLYGFQTDANGQTDGVVGINVIW